MSRINILFATDLHGSTLVLEKALSVAEEFEVDLVIIGGDLSGKRLIPIVRQSSGRFNASEPYKQKDDTGKSVEVHLAKDLLDSEMPMYLRRLEAKGYYWCIGNSDELLRLNESPRKLAKLFEDEIYKRIVRWAELVNQRIEKPVECIWTGGNDDDQMLLERLKAKDLGRFIYGEERILKVDNFEVLSFGFSNETQFHTSRELKEPELLAKLEELARGIENADNLLLNVHVPPKDCGAIDLCLDVTNPNKWVHVGSSAVLRFVEKYQPLVDFTGHVHEGKGTAKIGRTTVFNPGSNYNSGILQAFIVALEESKVGDYIHISR